MKNTLTEIGGWKIKNPELVIKIGLIADDYKEKKIPQLWADHEHRVLEKMPTFKKEHFFFQEEKRDGKLIYSLRYYTPPENRERIEAGGDGRH